MSEIAYLTIIFFHAAFGELKCKTGRDKSRCTVGQNAGKSLKIPSTLFMANSSALTTNEIAEDFFRYNLHRKPHCAVFIVKNHPPKQVQFCL